MQGYHSTRLDGAGPQHHSLEGRRGQLLQVNHVRVIPQPFGSLLAKVLDERGQIHRPDLAQAAVSLIDIGGKTCNLLSVSRLSEIGRETASVNVGGWTLVRAVRQWLAQNYPGLDDLRDHQLAAAIQARSIRYYGVLATINARGAQIVTRSSAVRRMV